MLNLQKSIPSIEGIWSTEEQVFNSNPSDQYLKRNMNSLNPSTAIAMIAQAGGSQLLLRLYASWNEICFDSQRLKIALMMQELIWGIIHTKIYQWTDREASLVSRYAT